MKKLSSFFATMALLLFAPTLSSCSDSEDDDKPSAPAAEEIAGNYKGDMVCTVMGDNSTFENVSVTVSSTDKATATIQFSSFGNPPMQIHGISISGVKVSGENGNYTLSSTEFSGTSENGEKYFGTAQGSYAKGVLSVKFSLNYGAMPMPMVCSFSASKE